MSERPPETGWLVDTSIDDNLVRQFLHNQADFVDIVTDGFDGVTARTPDVALAGSRCLVPYFNEALLLRPVLSAEDPVLDEIDAFYAGGPASTWVILSAWPTPDLSGRGYQLVGHPAFVIRTPGVELREPAPRPGVDLRVRRAVEPDEVRAAERVMADGYPVEEAQGQPGSAFPGSLGRSAATVRVVLLELELAGRLERQGALVAWR